MIVNGGSIESTGQAIARLHSLLAVRPAKRTMTAAAVVSLEKRGFVVRDNRTVGNIGPRKIYNSDRVVQPKGCFGVHLAKEPDELYAEITDLPLYITELREVIQQRMIGRAVKAKKEEPVGGGKAMPPEGPTVAQPEPPSDPKLVSALSQWDPAAIADALLEKVIERAKGIDSPDLLLTIQQKDEIIAGQKKQIGDLASVVTQYTNRHVKLEHNLSEMTKRVNVLADENEKLKAQARSFRDRGGHLKAEIKDILAPSDRLALDRLMKGKQ